MALVSALEVNETLEGINISKNQISKEGLMYLVDVLKNRKNPLYIKDLNLTKNELKGGPTNLFFSYLNEKMTLKKLKLSDCTLNCHNIEIFLNSMQMNKNLIKLDLSSNNLNLA